MFNKINLFLSWKTILTLVTLAASMAPNWTHEVTSVHHQQPLGSGEYLPPSPGQGHKLLKDMADKNEKNPS